MLINTPGYGLLQRVSQLGKAARYAGHVSHCEINFLKTFKKISLVGNI